MTTRLVSTQDGPRLTVAQMVKQPRLIPARVIKMMDQEFIVDSILRRAGGNESGVVLYEESTPMFADGTAAVVEEFGEIPMISGRVGKRKVARTVKRGLAIKVSQEMVNRNNVDAVNRQVTQVKNTMIRTWEDAFFQIISTHPDIPTIAAATTWGAANSAIRKDLAAAKRTIKNATTVDDADNFFGFDPDTLIIGTGTETDFLASDDLAKVFEKSPLASENPQYKGTLPRDIFGLVTMVSRRIPAGRALMLERGTLGGISDERPMSATPLYEDRPTETWRSDVIRQSAMFVDQPKAAIWITGV